MSVHLSDGYSQMGLLPLSAGVRFSSKVSHRLFPGDDGESEAAACATPCGVRFASRGFRIAVHPVWTPATSYMLQTSSIRAASAGVTGLYGSWVCKRGRCIAGWSRVKP